MAASAKFAFLGFIKITTFRTVLQEEASEGRPWIGGLVDGSECTMLSPLLPAQ